MRLLSRPLLARPLLEPIILLLVKSWRQLTTAQMKKQYIISSQTTRFSTTTPKIKKLLLTSQKMPTLQHAVAKPLPTTSRKEKRVLLELPRENGHASVAEQMIADPSK